jgi:alpha-L-fucosidase 2
MRINFFFIEDTLWTGIPGDYTDKNAPEELAKVRKLVDDRKYSEASIEATKLTGGSTEVCTILQIDITLHAVYEKLLFFKLMLGIDK